MAKSSKKERTSRPPRDRAPVTTDPRFATIHSDPRFAPPKKKDTKLSIDKRFSRVLSDARFSSTAAVDRYGRKLPKEAGREELERFYELEDDEEEKEEEEEGDGEENLGKKRFDPARGEGIIDTSSEEESDEEEEGGLGAEEEEVERHAREQLQAVNDVPTGKVTRRLACVNLDWDNVRAMDLMKAFASFAPSGGKVMRLAVYPSEFGKERMDREEMEGPPSEIFRKDEQHVDDEEEEVSEKTIVKEDKGEEFDSAKLRVYQLERLRYYYAVAECDSERTAHHIYECCDGVEYEATANFFDLRFIPDETSFQNDTPRDECTHDPTEYTPAEFATDALQHSKVKLTWDQDDEQRKQVAKRAFSQRDIEENELKAYLASSDSESEVEDKDTAKEKYRALLGGLTFGKDKESSGDMKVTFTSGLEGSKNDGKVISDEETTIGKYARKERERRKSKKERMKAARETANGDGAPKEQRTAEARVEEPSQAAVDLGFDDPFFDEPVRSNVALKKEEKIKRREEKQKDAAEKASKRAELELLMADDDAIVGAGGRKLSHFDMKEIVKAEKSSKKFKKSKRKKGMKDDGEGLQEGFELDVKDPRFSAVFERHDFAIDPTNPKFMKTEGTKKLLEERRKRSAARGPGKNDVPDEDSGRRKRKKTVGKRDEVQDLVQSLKKKSKAVKA